MELTRTGIRLRIRVKSGLDLVYLVLLLSLLLVLQKLSPAAAYYFPQRRACATS
jgi:hypothetical protein